MATILFLNLFHGEMTFPFLGFTNIIHSLVVNEEKAQYGHSLSEF